MKIRSDPIAVLTAILVLIPFVTAVLGEDYYLTFVTRILIFGIAASSLNLILGVGGMTSLGHAAFIGIGAYSVGLLTQNGIANGFVHFACAIVVGSTIALIVGAICLRTNGLAFIMLTLASAQLLFFITSGLKQYGGDDGFSFRGRSEFGGMIPLDKPVVMYCFVAAWLLATAWMMRRLVQSRFGLALRSIKSNEQRADSIGFPVYRYKLAAFVLAGAICSISGALLANLTQFVSPAYMHWSRSAELLLMVLLGGTTHAVGPFVGAATLLLMEEGFAAVTAHWQALLGIVLVVIVMFARNGLADIRLLLRNARKARA